MEPAVCGIVEIHDTLPQTKLKQRDVRRRLPARPPEPQQGDVQHALPQGGAPGDAPPQTLSREGPRLAAGQVEAEAVVHAPVRAEIALPEGPRRAPVRDRGPICIRSMTMCRRSGSAYPADRTGPRTSPGSGVHLPRIAAQGFEIVVRARGTLSTGKVVPHGAKIRSSRPSPRPRSTSTTARDTFIFRFALSVTRPTYTVAFAADCATATANLQGVVTHVDVDHDWPPVGEVPGGRIALCPRLVAIHTHRK